MQRLDGLVRSAREATNAASGRWLVTADYNGSAVASASLEELYSSRFEGVLSADYHKPSILNQPLEQVRSVAEMVDRCANVRPHCVMNEIIERNVWIGAQQLLD